MPRITVVAFLHPSPSVRPAVLAAAEAQFRRRPAEVPGRIDACLFEDAEDPSRLLYVGRWQSREAFEAYLAVAPRPSPPAWDPADLTVTAYRPIATYVEMLAPGEAASFLALEWPPECAQAPRDVLLEYARGLSPKEHGMVEYELGESLDRAGHFMAFVRWRSVAVREAFRAGYGARLVAELAEHGARVQRFNGSQRVEVLREAPS